MKKLLLLSLLLVGLGCSSNLSAQKYSSAIGLRFGYPNSVSYKMFLSEANALEVFGAFDTQRSVVAGLNAGWTSLGLGAAYLIHADFANSDGLSWYYGGGANIDFFTYGNDYSGSGGNISLGISGYLGLDYKFGNAPINITLDISPTFFLIGNGGFVGKHGTLGVRYVLGE